MLVYINHSFPVYVGSHLHITNTSQTSTPAASTQHGADFPQCSEQAVSKHGYFIHPYRERFDVNTIPLN